MGGEPAPLRAAARRARAARARARASFAQLHTRPAQLARLADQHQPAPRVGGVAPQLAGQSALRQDRRDEDQGGPAAHQAQ